MKENTNVQKKTFNFLGENIYCNPMSFCRSFSSGYYLWGGTTGIRDEEMLEKSSLMYRVNSDMQIESGYFSTQYGDGGVNNPFKYYKDYVLVNPSSFDYKIYQISSDDSVRIRYSFDFGKYGFDSSRDVYKKTIPVDDFIRNIDYYQETDRLLYFIFSYNNIIHNLLYSKITEQQYILNLSPSLNGKEFRLFPIVMTCNNQFVAIVPISALKFELKRMSQANIKKWGLEDLKKLDDEDNPVLAFYTMKL